MSIKGIWANLQEFSIDWFSYLLPYLGRIMKIEPNAEYSKLEVQLQEVKRNVSASRIRVSEAAKSYVPGTSKVKISQKDKAR